MWKRVFGAITALALIVGAAQAQAQAQGQAQGKNGAPGAAEPAISYQVLQAQGYNLFDPAQIRTKLENAGFEVQSDQGSPDGRARVIATTVASQVFIFGFSDCAPEGCLFLRAIHPIPTAAAGLQISTAIVNDLNAATPLGHYVYEQGGNVSLRYYIPALPECAEQCLDSHLVLFMNGTRVAHQTLMEVGSQRVARATGDSFARNPLVSVVADKTFTADLVSALTISETPFVARGGYAGTGSGNVDIRQVSGFEGWQPSWGELVPEGYDEKISNNLN